MKEEIDAWKEKNGNNHFTQKEMIIGILSKLEKIDDRLVEGEKRFVNKNLLWRISGGLFILLSSLTYYVIILRGV